MQKVKRTVEGDHVVREELKEVRSWLTLKD
jgi:hypothetical protein